MTRKMLLRAVLWVGILGVFAVLAPNPVLSQPKGKPRGNGYARRVLRHKEHQLLRKARHEEREAARERRQAAALKRVLRRHKK